MNAMIATLRFLTANPRRIAGTLISLVVIWGMISPDSLHSVSAELLRNFWVAFGPIILLILQLLALVAGASLMIWVVRKGCGGGGSTQNHRRR
jgi:hypothetical protein